jgi:hypothetical protein
MKSLAPAMTDPAVEELRRAAAQLREELEAVGMLPVAMPSASGTARS